MLFTRLQRRFVLVYASMLLLIPLAAVGFMLQARWGTLSWGVAAAWLILVLLIGRRGRRSPHGD